MINTGTTDLKYLALSTMQREEICEYPDSGKVGVFLGHHGKMDYRKLFRSGSDVHYLDGENSERLKK